MKKKFLIIALAVMMCIAFVSCTDTEKEETETAPAVSQTESTSAKAEKETEKSTQKVNITKEKTTVAQTKKATTTTKPQAIKPVQTTAAAAKATTEKQTTTEEKRITVSLAISCRNALKYDDSLPQSGYFANESIEVKEGETAFSVLESVCKKQGLTLEARGNYIVAIGGLREKQCTSASGWMYTVNGALPNKPAKKYALKDGDVVEFYYITSPSDRA